MRVLVISDTHSKHTNLEEVLKREPPFDLVIHLGDAEGFQQQISEMVNCPYLIWSRKRLFRLAAIRRL